LRAAPQRLDAGGLFYLPWKDNNLPSRVIMHTDRGSQYGADSYRQLLRQHGIEPSMSRKGNCWDNAVAESFFHTLKTELISLEDYDTHEAAQTAVFEYIEVFYNRQRCHSANGYLAPLLY
jgi:putative transposase